MVANTVNPMIDTQKILSWGGSTKIAANATTASTPRTRRFTPERAQLCVSPDFDPVWFSLFNGSLDPRICRSLPVIRWDALRSAPGGGGVARGIGIDGGAGPTAARIWGGLCVIPGGGGRVGCLCCCCCCLLLCAILCLDILDSCLSVMGNTNSYFNLTTTTRYFYLVRPDSFFSQFGT